MSRFLSSSMIKRPFLEILCRMRGLHGERGRCKIDGTEAMVILKHMFSTIKRTFTARPSVPRDGRARRMVGCVALPREQHSTARAERERPRRARRAPGGRKHGRKGNIQMGYEIIQEMGRRAEACRITVRQEKAKQGYSNKRLAEESGVGESTMNKMLSGAISNPGIIQAAAVCRVLGVSLDKEMGLESDGGKPEDAGALLDEKDRAIERLLERSRMQAEELKEVRGTYRPMIFGLCGLCVLLTVVWGIYVILDAQQPDIGLIKSGSVSPVVWIGAAGVVVVLGMLLYITVRRWLKRR